MVYCKDFLAVFFCCLRTFPRRLVGIFPNFCKRYFHLIRCSSCQDMIVKNKTNLFFLFSRAFSNGQEFSFQPRLVCVVHLSIIFLPIRICVLKEKVSPQLVGDIRHTTLVKRCPILLLLLLARNLLSWDNGLPKKYRRR